MNITKTNAMRILDKAKLKYEVLTYEHQGEAVDGLQVAAKLHQLPQQVFKTLVLTSNTKHYYVFMVPVDCELDLKKCARCVNEKSLEMIHVKNLLSISGYIRGGCSPIGMKKAYPTVLHESALRFDKIYFSGGKIGIQIAMSPVLLLEFIHAKTADIVKKA